MRGPIDEKTGMIVENLARFIFHKVQDGIGGDVTVERVVVRRTSRYGRNIRAEGCESSLP